MSLVEHAPAKVRGPNGGARLGAGRKPGGTNQRTRRNIMRAIDLCNEHGVTPLEVIFLSMIFHHKKAQDYLEIMDKCVTFLRKELGRHDSDDDQQKRDEIFEYIKRLTDVALAFENSDDKAVDRAVSGAAFVHPRLTAIAVKGEMMHNSAPVEINSNMTVEEKQRAYAEELKRHGPQL